MKKMKIIASLAVLMIVAAVIIRYAMGSKAEYTEESIPTIAFTDFDGDGLVKDEDADFGSAQNPLLILEIVPIKNMAEMGYMISGCEPVDMELIKSNETLASWYKSKFCRGGQESVATDLGNGQPVVTSYKFPDEFKAGDKVQYNDGDQYQYYVYMSWLNRYDMGYGPITAIMDEGVEKTNESLGCWLSWAGGYRELSGYYQKVEKGTGKFVLEGTTFKLMGTNKGDYIWVTAENPQNVEPDYTADVVWTKRTGNTFGYREHQIVNNNVLIKEAFGSDVDADSIVAQVITVTPYELRKSDNLALIADADLISIHGKSHDGNLEAKWEECNIDLGGNHVVLTDEEKARNTFAKNDFTWETVMTLLGRMASDNPAGLILDAAVDNENGMSNSHKLCMMLLQSSPLEFQTCFVDTGKMTEQEYKDSIDGYDLRTGVYNKTVNGSTQQIADWSSLEVFYDYSIDINYRVQWGSVQNKIYWYNGSNAMFDLYLERVDGNEYNQEVFEYYDDIGEPKNELTGNLIVRYLLQDTTMKRELKILEVQPCNKFIYGEEGWQEYYVKLFPWLDGKLEQCVKVTTMPTWQFNSSIEDLNSEYDVVIFGVKQDVSNGLNGYNDPNMNVNGKKGFIYSGIGDLVNPKEGISGQWGEKSSNAMRYSGNDIIAKKVEELKSFLNAGKAVILDNGFMGRGVSSGVNTKVVDPSSNMYQFASMYNQAVEGVNTNYLFVNRLYQANTLRKAVAYETCRLFFVPSDAGNGYPAEYAYEEDAANSNAIKGGTVIYADRTLQYQFRIKGKVGTLYQISLYVDNNGDGIYEGSCSDPVSADEIIQEGEEATGKESEAVGGFTVQDSSGNMVDPTQLKPNVTYILTKQLEDFYQGVIPWKLEAHIADNTNCRSNIVKYSAIKTTKENKKKLDILLMNPTPDMTEPEAYYSKHCSNLNNKSDGYGIIRMDQVEKFRTYLEAVDEYDITLTYLSNTNWSASFGPNAAGYAGTEESQRAAKIQAWGDYLDGYDMLVLGFNDECTFTDNEVYYAGFQQFVDSGKGVIVSHDMVRDTSQKKELKVIFDEQLRQMMGQRRYYTDKVMMNNKEVSLLQSGDNAKFNTAANSGTLPGLYDNSTRLFTVMGGGKPDRDSSVTGSIGWKNSVTETEYINIVNRGQVTNYPYSIPSLIKVAPTHTQNYQLDLENEDMVVWYTLTDQYSKNYADHVKSILGEGSYNSTVMADNLGRGLYSSIESDGRNSFYMYNIGNITYTGLGHKTTLTDDEIKLFVNTMIASYRATPEPPELEITNEEAIIDGSNATIYVPFDENLDYTTMIDVCYRVKDSSVLELNRTYTLEYQSSEAVTLDNIATFRIDNDVKTKAQIIGLPATLTPVERDGEYYFQVPYSEIMNGPKTYLLVLDSAYASAGGGVVRTSKTTRVTIMPMPMFNLN